MLTFLSEPDEPVTEPVITEAERFQRQLAGFGFQYVPESDEYRYWPYEMDIAHVARQLDACDIQYVHKGARRRLRVFAGGWWDGPVTQAVP